MSVLTGWLATQPTSTPEPNEHPTPGAEPMPATPRPTDQPLPTPGRECVQDALISLINQRKQIGIQTYGTPLMTHNGRDAVRDALEEACDLTVYLMQIDMETRDLRAQNTELAATIAAFPDAHDAANLAHARLQHDEQRTRADGLEATLTRVHQAIESITAAGTPPLGTSINRWVDRLLAELHTALVEQPKEQRR